jgi:glycine/serine hydroxymethyltransferase
MGVQEMTRFGMTEADFGELAQLMADLIRGGKTIKEDVRRFRQRFLDLQYCFRGEEFDGLVEKLHELV